MNRALLATIMYCVLLVVIAVCVYLKILSPLYLTGAIGILFGYLHGTYAPEKIGGTP